MSVRPQLFPRLFDAMSRRPLKRGVTLLLATGLTLASGLMAFPSSAMAAPVQISGVVTTSAGVPVAGIVVSADQTNGSASTTTGNNGSYSLQVAPGPTSLSVSTFPPGGSPKVYPLPMTVHTAVIQITGDTTENIPLPALAVLNVHVSDHAGNPAPGVGVAMFGTATAPAGTTSDGTALTASYGNGESGSSTDSSGTSTFGQLLGATNVTLQVLPTIGPSINLNNVAVPTDPTDLDVQLPELATISGVVTTSAGVPVAGMVVDADQTGGGTRAFTDSTGSYSLQVAPGPTTLTVANQLPGASPKIYPLPMKVRTAVIQISGDTTEDVAMPALAALDVHVSDHDGDPAPGVPVLSLGSSTAPAGSTSDGTALTATYGDGQTGCTTDSTGACTIGELLGSTTVTLQVIPTVGPTINLNSVAVPTDPTDLDVQLPALATISGVVTTSAGVPVAGVVVNGDQTSGGTSAVTDRNGSYSLQVAPGPTSLTVSTFSPGGTPLVYPLPMKVRTAVIQISGDTTESFTLPALVPLRLHIHDYAGTAVTGGGANFTGTATASVGTTADGTALTATYGDGETGCGTDSTGTCTIPELLGATGVHIQVLPPTGPSLNLNDVAITSDPTDLDITLDGFAVLPSTGSVPGTVAVSVPDGLTLSQASSQAVTSSPDGSTAVVGEMAYQVSGLDDGASADVTLTLPPGSNPNAVYKTVGGVPTDITASSTISGNVITLHLTDGGFGDSDGIANGVIVDPVIPAVRAALSITSASLPAGTVGTAYSTALQATGGHAPYTWGLASGTLPAGVTLSSAGLLSGTPTATGAKTFSVKVTDAEHPAVSVTKSLSITVASAGPKITVTTTTLPSGPVAKAYNATLVAAGGKTPRVWSIASGQLPAGLKLSTAGVISGTPTAVGTTSFTVSVHDASKPALVGTATESITITPMAITTVSLPSATKGKAYSAKLSASGGKATLVWSLAAGKLPAGLTLSKAGVISGKPTASGTFTVTIKVTDASKPVNTATRTLTLVVR